VDVSILAEEGAAKTLKSGKRPPLACCIWNIRESNLFKFPHLQKLVCGQRAVSMQSACICICGHGHSGNQHKLRLLKVVEGSIILKVMEILSNYISFMWKMKFCRLTSG